jgi:hypothetical protein
MAGELYSPSVYRVETGDCSQYGRLSAAAGPQQTTDITALNAEVKVMDNGLCTVPAGDVLDAEQWCGIAIYIESIH